jgi:hypothetical protein
LAEHFPRRLQILISQSDFAINYKPSQDEAKSSSEEISQIGYEPPHKINHVGHDRAAFVGNHQ